jgi:hypothetical protein
MKPDGHPLDDGIGRGWEKAGRCEIFHRARRPTPKAEILIRKDARQASISREGQRSRNSVRNALRIGLVGLRMLRLGVTALEPEFGLPHLVFEGASGSLKDVAVAV